MTAAGVARTEHLSRRPRTYAVLRISNVAFGANTSRLTASMEENLRTLIHTGHVLFVLKMRQAVRVHCACMILLIRFSAARKKKKKNQAERSGVKPEPAPLKTETRDGESFAFSAVGQLFADGMFWPLLRRNGGPVGSKFQIYIYFFSV